MLNDFFCVTKWRSVGQELPEIGTVYEEQAHHGAVQQEHTGHIEIRRVTHP